MRALWRGLSGKCQSLVHDPSFWPALRTPRQFSQKAEGTDYFILIMRFFDSWLHGASPGYTMCSRVGVVYSSTLIFQVSNRTIVCILKRSGRLCGDCMEPDHMAKYSLPMPTDLTENLIQKNQLFMY